MSGKKARSDRRMLSAHKMPALIDSGLVSVDHGRRIRRLSSVTDLSMQDAIKRYTRKMGMMPKPKL